MKQLLKVFVPTLTLTFALATRAQSMQPTEGEQESTTQTTQTYRAPDSANTTGMTAEDADEGRTATLDGDSQVEVQKTTKKKKSKKNSTDSTSSGATSGGNASSGGSAPAN